MPFKAEFRFFYLYLAAHLSEEYDLEVERGDDRIESRPIAEKVRRQIREADLVLADLTGANPNVFYELGLADALDKPMFLLTQDDMQHVPVDVRHLELIRYSLDDEKSLRDKLNKALSGFLFERYTELYEMSRDFLKEFNKDTNSAHAPVSKKDFQLQMVQAEKTQGIPKAEDALREFLLPRVMGTAVADVGVMKSVQSWLVKKTK
jgi:nucleoside 2-deoxyribosyltransferase